MKQIQYKNVFKSYVNLKKIVNFSQIIQKTFSDIPLFLIIYSKYISKYS